MGYIDTHAHLYASEFNEDIVEVINRALENNVEKILLPNIDLESILPLKSLVELQPNLFFPMMGLHPTSVNENYEHDLTIIKEELDTGKYIAVGEIGIDLYWDKTFAVQQEQAFIQQIEMALKLNLPIVVHARESFTEILEILKKYKSTTLKGVLHSFTGTKKQANEAIALGFYIGVGGISTFKNAGIGEIVKDLPLEKLILETDSPYLAPTPHRGKRNESSFLVHIAQKLATLKGTTPETIQSVTTHNANELFQL
ncbi:MAG: TatD family hydrolase [Salinivirgaceae bacterium]|jgi:TatD DNase family protein|nr:TatD family hydrolase [Salinivirgaceae bacterium]